MGSYGVALPGNTLLGVKVRSSSLLGRRIAVIQEPPTNRRINSEMFKLLTGGDILENNMPIYSKLILSGNFIPRLPDEPAVFRRVWQVVFPNSFIDNADVTLSDKLEAELPALLTLLVACSKDYLDKGLLVKGISNEPERVSIVLDNYGF